MERLFLYLPNTLASKPESRSDLIERHRFFAVEAEIQTQDLSFSSSETAESGVNLAAQTSMHYVVFRGFLPVIWKHIQQALVFFLL